MATRVPSYYSDSNGKDLYINDIVILDIDGQSFYAFVYQNDQKSMVRAFNSMRTDTGPRYKDYPLSTYHQFCTLYNPSLDYAPFSTAKELSSLIESYSSPIYFEDEEGQMLQVDASLRINLDGEIVIRLKEKQ